jgi:hypothetical protein
MTNGIDPNHPFEPKSKRCLMIAFVCLVFVVAIACLLWRIHAVDVQRRELALAQFKADTASLAGGLEYFFLERHSDLEAVVESRAVGGYFDNAALGTSTRFETQGSLQEVETLFANTLRRTACRSFSGFRGARSPGRCGRCPGAGVLGFGQRNIQRTFPKTRTLARVAAGP